MVSERQVSENSSKPAIKRLPLLIAALAAGILLIAGGIAIGAGKARESAANATPDRVKPTASSIAPSLTPDESIPAEGAPTPTATAEAVVVASPVVAIPEPTLDMDELPTAVPTRAVALNTGSYPGPSEPSVTEVPPPADQIPVPDGVMNVLLLGNDKRPEDPGLRTDTIILVSINTNEGTVNMISLPRDLLVYVPGWKMARINTIYAHGEAVGWPGGGFGLFQETLLYNFGIYVGHYAMVDLGGFQDIVDVLGGVEVTVDCAMQGYVLKEPRLRLEDFDSYDAYADYTDPESGNWELYTLPVGVHELDGYMALWYSRWRYGLDDFDRSYRQQQVLRAIVSQAREDGFLNLTRIPQLWREYNDLVQTSMGLRNMIDLAPVAADLEDVEIRSYVVTRAVTIPWDDPETETVDYYQLPNPEAIQSLFAVAMQPPAHNYVVNNTVTVEVRNGSSTPRLDEVAADRLGWMNIAASPTGAEEGDFPRTVIYDFTGREKTSQLERMQEELRVLEANIHVEPDPNRTFDYLVILGDDYRSCTRRQEQAPQPTLAPPGAVIEESVEEPAATEPPPATEPPAEATEAPPTEAPPAEAPAETPEGGS